MNIVPAGIPVGAAGTPLAQTAGPETDRVKHALDARRRRMVHDRQAEAAAGVSGPDGEDHQSGERDAGRQPCESPPNRKSGVAAAAPRKSKDHRRESGNLLDLIG